MITYIRGTGTSCLYRGTATRRWIGIDSGREYAALAAGCEVQYRRSGSWHPYPYPVDGQVRPASEGEEQR